MNVFLHREATQAVHRVDPFLCEVIFTHLGGSYSTFLLSQKELTLLNHFDVYMRVLKVDTRARFLFFKEMGISSISVLSEILGAGNEFRHLGVMISKDGCGKLEDDSGKGGKWEVL